MSAIIAIAWAFGLIVSLLPIYMFWGNVMLVQMFPEGYRWWMPWSRLVALLPFAALVHFHPFGVFAP